MRGLFLKGHARGRFKYVQFYDEHDEGTSIQRICLSNSINLDQLFREKGGMLLDAISVFHRVKIFEWKVSIMGGLLSEDMRKLGSNFFWSQRRHPLNWVFVELSQYILEKTDFLVDRKMTAHS